MTLLSQCFYMTLTRCVFRTQSNTSDVTFYENSEWLKAAVFLQKVPS